VAQLATACDLAAERDKLRAEMAKLGKVRSRVRRGRTLWRIDFSPHLRGSERYLHGIMGDSFVDEAEAQRTLSRICADMPRLGLGEAIAQFRQPRARRNTVSTHAERWLREAARSVEPHTLHAYRAVLRNHFGFWAVRGIREVTTTNTREWIAELHEKGLGPKTIDNALKVLRPIVRRYREDRPEVPEPIWPRVKVPRAPQQRMPLDEIVATLDAIPEPAAGIFLCAFYTASRPNEVRGTLVQDYDFKTGKLTICRALKTDSGANPYQGGSKTDESGVYVVPEDLGAWLQKWRGEARLDRSAPLFPHPTTGTAWESKRMRTAWERACARAGVDYVPVYRALKHSPVTALLEAGASLEDVQALCRHKRKSTTERYDLGNDQRRARGAGMLKELADTQRTPNPQAAESGSNGTQGHNGGSKR